MKKLLILFAVGICFSANAQMFEVVGIKQLQMDRMVYHPVFSPDGKSLVVSDEAYSGVGIISLNENKYRHLSDKLSAYKFAFADNNTIICRENNFTTMKERMVSLDIATKATKHLTDEIEHYNAVCVKDGKAITFSEGKKIAKRFTNKVVAKSAGDELLLTEEDLRLVLYRNGVRTEIDPFGDPELNYSWSSLSPDKSKVLFVAKNKTYTCNLDGSNLTLIGDFRAPVWLGNDHIVGMQDDDDGHFFTSSDIVVAEKSGRRFQQLTNVSKEIKMFPSVSPDGSQIAYHTLEGKIYVMTIKQK